MKKASATTTPVWNVEIQDDPLPVATDGAPGKLLKTNGCNSKSEEEVGTYIVRASCHMEDLLTDDDDDDGAQNLLLHRGTNDLKARNNNNNNHEDEGSSVNQRDHCIRVALADFVGRRLAAPVGGDDEPNSRGCLLSHDVPVMNGEVDHCHHFQLRLEPLERRTQGSSWHNQPRQRRRHRWQAASATSTIPYILERSDIRCTRQSLEIWARLVVCRGTTASAHPPPDSRSLSTAVSHMLAEWMEKDVLADTRLWNHVGTALVQHELRLALDSKKAVAFVANGSILPRHSGASQAPMASPPAVPFLAPSSHAHGIVGGEEVHLNATDDLTQTLQISLPRVLVPYLTLDPQHSSLCQKDGNDETETETVLSVTGLLIPHGVSLIVGGGYHGKSTLLRTLAAGIYNKVPGDGREFCVTCPAALTIRAEDGRYVHNCNVSAFLSNLPGTAPSRNTAAADGNAAGDSSTTTASTTCAMDTTHFGTHEASGSTSQAANVMEALELGCTAMLIDEDVSAANFMARDGRMRALVMDESITPLLYRVNGLFATKNVSSIVVVGGVGDWLDVPHHVVMMQNYQCYNATRKAQSISKQFSHGHVQYAGRGVVHRLDWDDYHFTPLPRRPQSDQSLMKNNAASLVVDLLQSGTGLVVGYDDSSELAEEEEEDWSMDLSRCEQLLLGQKPLLFGCGLAALWVLRASGQAPDKSLRELLDDLDRSLDQQGVLNVLLLNGTAQPPQWEILARALGHVYRPRRLEVGQALCRLRGLLLQEFPRAPELVAKAEALVQEEERKKRELMELWNSRRNKK